MITKTEAILVVAITNILLFKFGNVAEGDKVGWCVLASMIGIVTYIWIKSVYLDMRDYDKDRAERERQYHNRSEEVKEQERKEQRIAQTLREISEKERLERTTEEKGKPIKQ